VIDPKVDALIRLEVACRLALEALPRLPDDTERALRQHVEVLCEITGKQLNQLHPGWQSVSQADSQSSHE
jgi:hypothetical protein